MSIRNVAIIAHVDHGKTTLIDVLLRQSGTFRENESVAERALDSNDLERERGITILAKVTSILWNDSRINIVDTPGHADFGGEVERILNMVDGAIVLVDAAEGPMPQTKFVLHKALKIGLRPIVVINKIDKPDKRPDYVLNEVFDLFAALDADEDQLDFNVLYGSGKQGWISCDESPTSDMSALLDMVVSHIPPPSVGAGEFTMLATMIESDPYLGRLLTGKITSGTVSPNQMISALHHDSTPIEQCRITQVLSFDGLTRKPVASASAGDIVSIAGTAKANVADTLCDPTITIPLTAQPIDPPTLSMTLRVNDGPLAGKEGDKVQSRVIGERLFREAQGNVALKVCKHSDSDSFEVSGRGELQLAVLIETMRREGFELTVGRPRVLLRTDDTGTQLEPIEEAIIDVDEEYSGSVVEKLSVRRGELIEMKPSGTGRVRLIFHAPTRGLIGYLSQLLSDTRGTAIFNRTFLDYRTHRGDIPQRHTGTLISNGSGEAVAYALFNLEDRGSMMVSPGDIVYEGMIVGEHTRGNDLEVNVLRGKQLTNIRSAGKDDAVKLTTPMRMTLDQALSYITDDELVEVTPLSVRLRKRVLDPIERKRQSRL